MSQERFMAIDFDADPLAELSHFRAPGRGRPVSRTAQLPRASGWRHRAPGIAKARAWPGCPAC